MTVWNFGSINLDHVLHVPHLPGPGETLTATGSLLGLGGKGANQSVAAAMAGARVMHVGMVGRDGDHLRNMMADFGVDVTHVAARGGESGRAQITVDADGENTIVILPAANALQSADTVETALGAAAPGDILLMQNETSHQSLAAATAKERGLRVIYSAAPFDPNALRAVVEDIDILLVNAVEAAQLAEAFGHPVTALPLEAAVVTRGAEGAVWHDIARGGDPLHVESPRVVAVDTTGAGDCFAGYLAACLDGGASPEAAMRLAATAAALCCTVPGAADAMPRRSEVEKFLDMHSTHPAGADASGG